MKKKSFRRIATVAVAAAIGMGAVCMFAGCTSDRPEVTITYSFNNKTYDVSYRLERQDAPETVQHFIELADAGFYEGTVIHNYDTNFMYGGAYVLEDGALKEKDYFAFVKEYEKDHDAFTQSVYKTDEAHTPLYTVVGEFEHNGRGPVQRQNTHTRGALVMYYPSFENFSYDVRLERADGGDANDGNPYDTKKYLENSATSQFYTFLGDQRNDLIASYAVFGMAIDYEGEMVPLLDAIAEYSQGLGEDETFTTPSEDFPDKVKLFEGVQPDDEDFEELRRCGAEATDFNTPLKMPIIITSVKVDKY